MVNKVFLDILRGLLSPQEKTCHSDLFRCRVFVLWNFIFMGPA